MKESEYETAPEEWQNARIGYEAVNYFTLHRADYEPAEGYPTNSGLDPTDLDEKSLPKQEIWRSRFPEPP